ncbi:hypothetical protein N7493_007364 [Penicillium malachiteum]|uniref:Uncharacterized protein n=1 Tax=Penicillium malachiteum TaxID=1324776 RepID=A0AAD6MUV2_9EURO|nr:hypothetical protein N7493_007364 [Penicillium malachiteum]
MVLDSSVFKMPDTTIHTFPPHGDVLKQGVSKQKQLAPETQPEGVAQRKTQPWKGIHVPDASIVPQTFGLHDKPWYRTEDLDEAYESSSGS